MEGILAQIPNPSFESEFYQRYRARFKKYGGAKPIWSTEIGSKGQGLPRDVIAKDIVRYFIPLPGMHEVDITHYDGRRSTIDWFEGVHLKEIDFVGDVILAP